VPVDGLLEEVVPTLDLRTLVLAELDGVIRLSGDLRLLRGLPARLHPDAGGTDLEVLAGLHGDDHPFCLDALDFVAEVRMPGDHLEQVLEIGCGHFATLLPVSASTAASASSHVMNVFQCSKSYSSGVPSATVFLNETATHGVSALSFMMSS
jgi:hypothetical protein